MDKIPLEFFLEELTKLFHEDPAEFVSVIFKNFAHIYKRLEELEQKDGRK